MRQPPSQPFHLLIAPPPLNLFTILIFLQKSFLTKSSAMPKGHQELRGAAAAAVKKKEVALKDVRWSRRAPTKLLLFHTSQNGPLVALATDTVFQNV